MKNLLLLCFLLFFLAGACKNTSEDECPPDTNCSDYAAQYLAQLAFDLDPLCKNDLDADHDKIACEEWEDYYKSLVNNPGNSGNPGTSGCPTTAACGCSGKTKSNCEGSICCRWTVGSGCGCR